MSINLEKGQTIKLDKDVYDLSSITIGLGWDVAEAPVGILKKLLGGQKQEDYDLDAIAFLLDEKGKVRNLGNKLVGSDVVFYNNLKHPSGHIWLTGDNRTGAGDGDDEQIIVKLNSINSLYQKILFLVTIYQGKQKGQHFGKIKNAFIRAVDGKGREMAKFNLSAQPAFNNKCALIFAEVYRKDGDWKFRALGEPRETDGFVDILMAYTVQN